MKLFVLVTLLIISYSSEAEEAKRVLPQVYLTQENTDSSLPNNEAIYHFWFQDLNPTDRDAFILWSVDGVEYEGYLEEEELHIQTTPGKHIFQFYINPSYEEVFTDSLDIRSQTIAKYTVRLSLRPTAAPVQHVVYKPVIYLYPEQKQQLRVDLNVHGTRPFFYPNYDNGWGVIAKPNGDLTIDNDAYRYLFWEAYYPDHLQEIKVDAGFVVEGKDAVIFLEEKLTAVGFTSVERADFITFWGPKLAANSKNLVRFEWNETCDKFADLHVSPRPDQLFRFYIFMAPLDSDTTIKPQELPKLKREGFTVLEWGGQVSSYQPILTL